MITKFIVLWAQNQRSEKLLLRVAIHINMSISYERYQFTIICFYRDKIGSYHRHQRTVRWENRTWRHRLISIYPAYRMRHTNTITHCRLMMSYDVEDLGHHWFRQGPVANSAPSHHPNQCSLLDNLTPKNIFQWHFIRNSSISIQET